MTFDTLGLRPALLARLAEQDKTTPTPIQVQAIPHALSGRDVMGLAQTGTGKTLAFGLPLVDRLLGANTRCEPKTAQALILAPTRELAKQIHDTLAEYISGAHLRLGLVVGGASLNAQAQRLLKGMHILVATPGRLMDLIERRAVSLNATRYLVLDEADQMLDLGFIHTLRKIASMLPKPRQTMLFSATMPKQMAEIAGAFLTDAVRIEVSPPGKTADKVEQALIFAEAPARVDLLTDLLDGHRDELALVVTRTKHGAEKLSRKLESIGFAANAIHGNKSQGQRNRALDSFRSGEVRVLVATDVAARGIDIPDVRHVYNFDLPNVADNYVHRIGRTARAGRDGRAVSFCARDEMGALRDIEKLIGHEITVIGGQRPSERGSRPAAAGGKPGAGKPSSAKPASRNRRRRRPGGKPGALRAA